MYSISCSLQVECRWGSTFFADFLYELVPSLSNRDAVIVGGCGQLSSSWSDLLTYVKLVIALLHRSHMYEFFKNIFTVTIYLILFLDRARCCSEIMRVNFTVVFVVFELLEIVIRGQSVVKSQRPSVGWGWGSWGRGKNPHIGSLRSVVAPQRCPGQNHHHCREARWPVISLQCCRLLGRNCEWRGTTHGSRTGERPRLLCHCHPQGGLGGNGNIQPFQSRETSNGSPTQSMGWQWVDRSIQRPVLTWNLNCQLIT